MRRLRLGKEASHCLELGLGLRNWSLGYSGIMEHNMEATIQVLGFRVGLGFKV